MGKLNIVKASEIYYPLRFLVYAGSGGGKTHLAMQANMVRGMAPAIILSGDWGTATARHTDILVAMLDSSDVLTELLAGIKSKKYPFKTVILDGMSQFYDTIVLEKSGEQLPQIQDWLKASFDVKKIIRQFTRLGVNIIVTCLDQLLSEEEGGVNYTVPLVPGKMAFRLAEAFDIVGHTTTKSTPQGPHYIMRVQTGKRTIAKDRGGTLGAAEVDITWDGSGRPPMADIWTKWTTLSSATQEESSVSKVVSDTIEPGELTEDEVLLDLAG